MLPCYRGFRQLLEVSIETCAQRASFSAIGPRTREHDEIQRR